MCAHASETAPGPSPRLPVEELLTRIRGGDRYAAAELFDRYGDRLLRRIRRRLRGPVRTLWDSQDIAATVARRLDALVRSEAVHASSEDEVIALVTRIAQNAINDKNRILDRIRSSDAKAEGWAIRLTDDLSRRERSEDIETVLAEVFHRTPAASERELLSLWLQGLNHAEIARVTGRSHDAVRAQWSRLCRRLNAELSELAA